MAKLRGTLTEYEDGAAGLQDGLVEMQDVQYVQGCNLLTNTLLVWMPETHGRVCADHAPMLSLMKAAQTARALFDTERQPRGSDVVIHDRYAPAPRPPPRPASPRLASPPAPRTDAARPLPRYRANYCTLVRAILVYLEHTPECDNPDECIYAGDHGELVVDIVDIRREAEAAATPPGSPAKRPRLDSSA